MTKTFVASLTALGSLVLSLGGALNVSAVQCPPGTAMAGENVASYAECNLDAEDQPELIDTVMTIINVIVGLVGLAAVFVIVVGAVYFVTSQGDAAKVARGRNTILYGIVGLVISLLAFAIVNFALSSIFGGGSTGSSGNSGGDSTETEAVQEEA